MEQPAKILIIDDVPETIRLIGHLLGSDYRILFATEGSAGLELAQRMLPDLILLDVLMPGMDGFKLCNRLKHDPLTGEIPVIFVTALADEFDETQGFAVGGVDYITKPIRPAILKARVKTHLELKQNRDLLRRLAVQDPMTGIANRRRFDEVLEQEWRRAIRLDKVLSLIMMDVDHFKSFNDQYGHLVGDDCLRRLARAISAVVQRPGDLFARYGGEEFACLLPSTWLQGACTVAQRIREAVAALDIPPINAEGQIKKVTLSYGVANITPTLQLSPLALIEAADAQLYRAKQQGRDRIEAAAT